MITKKNLMMDNDRVTWYQMNENLKSMANSQAETETRNMMIYAIVLSVVSVSR